MPSYQEILWNSGGPTLGDLSPEQERMRDMQLAAIRLREAARKLERHLRSQQSHPTSVPLPPPRVTSSVPPKKIDTTTPVVNNSYEDDDYDYLGLQRVNKSLDL